MVCYIIKFYTSIRMDGAYEHNIEKKEASHKRTYTVGFHLYNFKIDKTKLYCTYIYVYIYGKTKVKQQNDPKHK